MRLAQAIFGSVGWRHDRAFAYLLPVCCVQTGQRVRSSTMPLARTGSFACGRHVHTQPRISEA
eukprot:1229892-Prymnesium_polylepis.1